MKRTLSLIAVVALATSVLALGIGIREAAPSTRAQATATATATPRLACTDATLGGRGALAANPKLAADCNALLALRYQLSRPDTLNWSPTVAITSATRGWDGVTVGTDAEGNKRVTGLSLAPYAFTLADLAPLDGIVPRCASTHTRRRRRPSRRRRPARRGRPERRAPRQPPGRRFRPIPVPASRRRLAARARPTWR